jgi:hypothetical protein
MVLLRSIERQGFATLVGVYERLAGVLVVAALGGGCSGAQGTTVEGAAIAHRSVLVGLVNKQQILDSDPRWSAAYERAAVDSDAARALAAVPAGAAVDVYLGTWCGDSVREVSRLLRYVDGMTTVPFALRLIAVDRSKNAPGFTEDVGLRYVPTVVVRRGGREVGRIIESPPREIGADLAALLDGSASGELSGR